MKARGFLDPFIEFKAVRCFNILNTSVNIYFHLTMIFTKTVKELFCRSPN